MAKESDGRLVHTPQGHDLWLFWGGFLSQWYLRPKHATQFSVNGVGYCCAEQWMMAEKARVFHDDATLGKILATKWPKAQKELGRQVQGFEEGVWVPQAQEIVARGNMAKFGQNPDLRARLIALPDLIAEASPYDRVWGIGLGEDDPQAADPQQWLGTNYLGNALMRVQKVMRT